MSDSEEDMRFEILGPLSVHSREREMTVNSRLEQALLATLLLSANRTVPVDRLVEALWDGTRPGNARAQLHGCVSRLRRRLARSGLADEVIVTDPGGYRAQVSRDAVDLHQFRTFLQRARTAIAERQRTDARDLYRAALGLWRGPALAGITSDQLRQAASAIDEERTQALAEWADTELALGGGSELVGTLTELVREHPYQERLHAALMLALYRADRQADALAAYQQVRRRLVAELGQEPGTALRALHQQILTSDDSLRPIRPGPDDAHPSAQRQHLPRTVSDFTGRQADLTWLLAAAEPTDEYTSPVIAIDGMPGVGKTCLAVRAAHQIKSRYPDGQLFIDLRGHSDNPPIDPAAALATLLGQLGIPAARIPAYMNGRTSLWGSELATRQVLVVLDNAASAAQVAPLLPAAGGSLVLITSRRRLVDLESVRPRSLDILHPDEAIALLERIAGTRAQAEPAATAMVARRCGYLPLALRVAAARLSHRPGWLVQDLASRLAAPAAPITRLSREDGSIGNAFTLSYRHLSPPVQRLFRLLGLHPGTEFDAKVAAALAELSLEEAQRQLDELVDSHLVEEPSAGRYRLHDLVHAYAHELTAASDKSSIRREAGTNLLDYYLHAAATASKCLESTVSRRNFDPGKPLRPDLLDHHSRGLEWLEVERANLVAAVRYAVASNQPGYGWRLARAMWAFLFLRCHMDDLFNTHGHGLAAAQQLADPRATAVMHNYLASAHYRVGNYREAIEHLRPAIVWREKTDDFIGLAVARRNLAAVYSMTGRTEDSVRQFEWALAAARRSRDPEVLASAVTNAGAGYLMVGRNQDALKHSRRGLVLSREAADPHLRAIALGTIGAARARLGQPEQGLPLLRAALRLKRQIGNRYGEAETLNDIGETLRTLGQLTAATVSHREALVVMREIGDRQGESTVCTDLGRTLYAAGDRVSALELHQRALTGSTKIQHRYGQARALDGIASCLQDDDPAAARRHWLLALEHYRELDHPDQHDIERRLAELAPDAASPGTG